MDEWDESAAGWDGNEAVQAYADGAFASLTSLAPAVGFTLDGAAACDFGCGTGLLTERLAGRCARIDAIDTSRAMREELRIKIDRHGWSHVHLLEELPSTPQDYDLVVCSSVLAFVDDHPAMVQALATHLGPGGLFVQWDWELDPDDAEPDGLTTADMGRALERAGLEAVTVGVGFEVAIDGDVMRPLMGSARRAG